MIAQPLRKLLIFAAGLFLGATAHAAGEPTADPVAAAIGSSERPAEDRSQDAWRQPAAVLAFFGVKPGMHVIDIFSAGGYNTELLSRTVGVKGEVIAYNNPPYASFAAKDIAARYAGDRLGNVRQVTAEVGALTLEPRQLDAALFVMCYHDLYWRPKDGSWNATDPKRCCSEAARGAEDGRRGGRAGSRRNARRRHGRDRRQGAPHRSGARAARFRGGRFQARR